MDSNYISPSVKAYSIQKEERKGGDPITCSGSQAYCPEDARRVLGKGGLRIYDTPQGCFPATTHSPMSWPLRLLISLLTCLLESRHKLLEDDNLAVEGMTSSRWGAGKNGKVVCLACSPAHPLCSRR